MGKELSCFKLKNNCCLLKLLLPNQLQPSGMMPLSLLLALLQIMAALLGFPRSHQGTQTLPLAAAEILMRGIYRPQLCPWSSSLCSPCLPAQKGITSLSFSLCNVRGWRKISCSVLSPHWTLLHLGRNILVHPRHQFVLGRSVEGKDLGISMRTKSSPFFSHLPCTKNMQLHFSCQISMLFHFLFFYPSFLPHHHLNFWSRSRKVQRDSCVLWVGVWVWYMHTTQVSR